MSGFNTNLNKNDLKLMIEAIDAWEEQENKEIYVLQIVKSLILPPVDSEEYEKIKYLKDSYEAQANDLLSRREIKREKATLLKAKLYILSQAMSVEDFLDSASKSSKEEELEKKLSTAERYIEETGLLNNYKKWLENNNVFY